LEDEGDGGRDAGGPVDLVGLAEDGWDVRPCEVCFVRRAQNLDCLGDTGYCWVCVVDEDDLIGVQEEAVVVGEIWSRSPWKGARIGNFA
jgi:hypothetical protein